MLFQVGNWNGVVTLAKTDVSCDIPRRQAVVIQVVVILDPEPVFRKKFSTVKAGHI